MKAFRPRIDLRFLASLSGGCALALVVVAVASASAPFNTSMPTMTQSGDTLTLHNGGWMTYSGDVDRYVFRFTRNGVLVKGPESVPMTSPPDEHLTGEYPNDPQANVYQLQAGDSGQTFCGEVWGGTHSIHYYDLIEWGHTAPDGTPAQVCMTVGTVSGGGGGGGGGSGGSAASGSSGVPALALAPAGLPTAVAGFAYPTQTLSTTGGTAPYVYSVTGGSLPQRITLSSAGVITGTPNHAGSSTFAVKAQDAGGRAATRSYTIEVTWPKLAVSPVELPTLVSDAPATLQLSASGGIPPYSFRLAEGQLPAGLELRPDGLLSGTPSARAGRFRFTVAVADANGAPANVAYTLVLKAPTLMLVTELSRARVGVRYRARLFAIGGAEPYWFAKVDGALPRGLVLSGSGVVSGVPKRAGTYGVRIRAYDANGATGERVYRIVVRKRS